MSIFLKKRIFLVIFFLLFYQVSFAELTSGECWAAGAAEVLIPGSGYAYSGQYDKALLIGGGRWASARLYSDSIKSDQYQKEPKDIYKTTKAKDSKSGKTETDIFMNRETWDVNYYGRIGLNLTLISIWDMYEHDCTPNTDTYKQAFAPFNIAHLYKNPWFWGPMALILYNYTTYEETNKTTWYLGNGLTKSRMNQDGFLAQMSTGMGEEMFFRGTVQKSLYNYLKSEGYDSNTSYHGGVWLNAAIFGLAHNGSGFSASSSTAFLFGLYQGYVYQSPNEEYDLETVIAIHSWWNYILFYTILNKSKVIESDDPSTQIPIMNINFQF